MKHDRQGVRQINDWWQKQPYCHSSFSPYCLGVMNKLNRRIPIAYFITLTTYGTWLHGDPRGSVDRRYHNQFDTPRIMPNKNLYTHMQKITQSKPVVFNDCQRPVVMRAIQSASEYYDWRLYAIHVRSNHVHLIVSALITPEKIMNQFKAYASRALNKLTPTPSPQAYWARHGSTRYIWSEAFLFPVMHYVIDQQGDRMACYYEPWYDDLLK